VTLLEGICGVGILTIATGAALSATLASVRVVNSPPARDLALVAAHNAAVEARAVAAYDANAAAAILAAPPASWSENGVGMRSSIEGQTLVVVASAGTESATARYNVTREGLPQGAIVDANGNIVSP
jgi:hypothetical protein